MAKVFTITEGLENMGAMKTGGQGSVYKGRRTGEIITAIKLLPTPIYSESADDKNFIAFQNEVQKLRRVNEEPNPNVVKILSSGITESGNFPYIEMEYIEGPDLEELLKPPYDGLFTIKEVLKVAEHLSHALAHCHKADVKHGDIKSNNVKYNINTGNYVLLDFGLAVMSDEQRRTSLRQAGAIEFMAPEQNEGIMLFQTDVYSFGVILFELLGGTVPFPLNDKSETGRNNVMIAHLEKTPPDVISARLLAMPETWSIDKKEQEIKVPDWLISLVYKCLEKEPQNRFKNGVQLHKHIWENTIRTSDPAASTNDRINFLEQENNRLRIEREQLNQQLLQYRHQPKLTSLASQSLPESNGGTNYKKGLDIGAKKPAFLGKLAVTVLVAFLVLALLVFAFVKSNFSSSPPVEVPSNKKAIGNYMVIAPKAYFYNKPDVDTRRTAFAVPGMSGIAAFDDKNGYIYTEITNEKGQTSKGWLSKQDLMTDKEYNAKYSSQALGAPVSAAVQAQLQQAKQFISDQKMTEALTIYSVYAKQEVPEAMYQYAKLALQNRNKNITCAEAFSLLKKANNKGYMPAKRTLGFLYIYANDKEALQQNNYYERCTFSRNVPKGSKLLMEAMLAGDTTAARLLTEINAKQE